MKKRRILFLTACALTLLSHLSFSQNKYEDTFFYELIDGKIAVNVQLAGQSKQYKFLLDPAAKSAVLNEFAEELGATSKPVSNPSKEYSRDGVNVTSSGALKGVLVGDNIFVEQLEVSLIAAPSFSKLGIAGVLGANAFSDNVLTIDAKDKTITTSTPYKPSYIKAKNRSDIVKHKTSIQANNQTITVSLDLLNNQTLSLTESDLSKVKSMVSGDILSSFIFANNKLENQPISIIPDGKQSSIGSKILDFGIVAIDYPNSKIYFQPYTDLVKPQQAPTQPTNITTTATAQGTPINLTRTMFLDEIFNYRASEKWSYQGSIPAIIDFWASWCAPCKKLSPILDELAKEYEGRIAIYKVNVDEEKELKSYFKADGIPLLLFIPMEGDPTPSMGIKTKDELKQLIDGILLK